MLLLLRIVVLVRLMLQRRRWGWLLLRRWTQLLQLLRVDNLTLLHYLRHSTSCLGMLQLRLVLRRSPFRMYLLLTKVLRLLQLRLRRRRKLRLLLELGVLWKSVLSLSLLGSLLLLILIEVALLLHKVLAVWRSFSRTWAWCSWWSKGLIPVRTLGMLNDRLVALVLLLVGLLLWWLRTLVLIRAVVLYPALFLKATFGVYSVEWGPIVLILVRVWNELLSVLLILVVFGWHLRGIGVLLEEGVKAWAALVLLDRCGQLWLGAVALVILLRRRVQTRRVLRLILLRSILSPSGRLASSDCVLVCLLRGILLLVACESGSNAAESRLLGLLLYVHGRGWL